MNAAAPGMDWAPLEVTLRLAAATTVVLLALGLPLGYWLAHTRSRARVVVDALVALPLVLPPTVLGFYLLLAFGPAYAPGRALAHWLGTSLAFSFPGLVVGSVVFSLPFMVLPVQSGLAALPPSLREAAQTMGKREPSIALHVLFPAAWPSILAGVMLAFAHTVGEFGIVLMIGGNIPGSTRVASIAIYDAVEGMHYGAAHAYAAVLVVLSFAVLLLVARLRRRTARPASSRVTAAAKVLP